MDDWAAYLSGARGQVCGMTTVTGRHGQKYCQLCNPRPLTICSGGQHGVPVIDARRRLYPLVTLPLEALEAHRESVSIGMVLGAARQLDGATVQPRQGLEHGAVVLAEQPLGYMQPIVRVDADQMRIEGCVMDLRQREAVWHHRLAESLVRVRDDVGRV